MESMTITIGIGAGLIPPAYLAQCNGTKVSLQTTSTETMLHVHFEPPPPVSSLLERLRLKTAEIIPSLSEQSQEILWHILSTHDGWAIREDLIDDVWAGKYPEPSTVRKAVSVLNATLKNLNFGYAVVSRKGIYRLIPVTW